MDFTIPEELKMLQTLARDFVKEKLLPLERELLGQDGDPHRKLQLPHETEENLIKMVKGMGLWGLGLPEELGGVGLSTLGICLVEEELAKTIVPFNFGDVTPLLFDGNEKQREYYLFPVLGKRRQAHIALLEPGKGTDLANMQTRAEKVADGYLLNGIKISLSPINGDDFAIVFALTNPDAGVRGGVTCFLVDRSTPGFTVVNNGRKDEGQTLPAKPVSLIFNDCLVPPENILGEEGKAFYLGSKWLPQRRIIRGARCIGAATRLLEASTEYAKTWERFGRPITSWLSVQAALAEIAADVQASRLMVHYAAWKADRGELVSRETAMVKLLTTQMLARAADRAVHIHGGPIYADELPLERLCQNAVVSSALERAMELQRTIIISDLLKGIGR